VSRDRGGEYAEAARRAAPQAVQVADRFHLLKNLRDVVSRVFKQYAEVLDLVPSPTDHLQRLANLRLWIARPQRGARGNRRGTSSEPLRLHSRPFEEGHQERPGGQRARDTPPHCGEISGLQDSARATSLHQEGTKKVSAIAPYEDYILGRWKQGCRNATQIHREISLSEQGYPGAYQNVGDGSLATSRNRSACQNPSPSVRQVSQPAMLRGSL
jgi:transposase